MDETLYDQAQALLVPIWRGIPAGYKRHYRRTIWQQFEDAIRSAAYTSSLSKLVSTLCVRLGVAIPTESLPQVSQILHSGMDRHLLKLLRDEATTCTLLVRLENEQRQAEWEARERAREFEEEQAPLDGASLVREEE